VTLVAKVTALMHAELKLRAEALGTFLALVPLEGRVHSLQTGQIQRIDV
jgi:hypothetical protein